MSGIMRAPRRSLINASENREFFPTSSRREAVEVEERQTVYRDFADLYHPPQVDQGLVINLIFREQLRVITEVTQKPTQLPNRPGCAVQAAGHETSGQVPGLEDSQTYFVIRLLLVPAVLRPIHPNEEKAVRNRVNRRDICRAERLEIALHAAPSLLPS